MKEHSFLPPFDEVDTQGGRMVSKYFRTSGSSEVFSNFVRLTPDRQSKKGAVWSRKPIGLETVTSVMKFRISGQGKTFFGDGIGLWFTNSAFYQEGTLHGFIEKFSGIGIIFDTFKNTENAGAHRDVTILVNDGEKTHEMMVKDVQGCNMNVRYHNERADFSVTDSSFTQVELSSNRLVVSVDARGNGNYINCVTIDNLDHYGLKYNWLKESYIGVTGSTGALADNHDVISLVTATDGHTARQAGEKQYYNYPPRGASDAQRIESLENAMNKLLMEHETSSLTHELRGASVDDKIANILGKLSKREDEAEQRIEHIEHVIEQSVAEQIGEHVEGALSIEEGVQRKIDRDLQQHKFEISDQLHNERKRAGEAIAKMLEENAGATAGAAGGGYMWAFVVLAIIMAAGLFIAYKFYYQLKKKNFLD